MAKTQNTYLNKEGLGSFLSNLKKIFLGTKTITSAVDWNTLTENGHKDNSRNKQTCY